MEERKDTMFRIAPKYMIYARAYYRGEVLAEVSDIGFSNIDEVIARLCNSARSGFLFAPTFLLYFSSKKKRKSKSEVVFVVVVVLYYTTLGV